MKVPEIFKGDGLQQCKEINVLVIILIGMMLLIPFFLFFSCGRTVDKRINQMGQNIESIRPPEVEPPETVGNVPVAPAPPNAGQAGAVAIGLPKSTMIGVDVVPIDRWNQERLGLNVRDAATISSVVHKSPADKAGLKTDDTVYQIGNEAVEGVDDFIKIVSGFVDGKTYTIRFYRGGKKQKAYLTYRATPGQRVAAAMAPEDPWIGVDVQPLNMYMQRQFGLPDTNGAIVSFIEKDAPALDAGVQQGDVVTAIDGHKVNSPDDLQNYINGRKVGDQVQMSYLRQGEVLTSKVAVIAKPQIIVKPEPTFLPEPAIEVEASWVGMTLEPLTKAESKELGLTPDQGGMVVEAVAKDSPADKAGMQLEDVILTVNGTPLKTLTVFQDAAENANGAVMDIIRTEKHLYITIYPPKPFIKSKKANLKQVALAGEFAYKKIAIGSYGSGLFDQVYPTFEQSPYILIYDPNTGDYETMVNTPGGDPLAVCRVLIGRRIASVIAGNMDQNCKVMMMSENIAVYTGVFGHLYYVVGLYKQNKLIANRLRAAN